MQKLDKKQIFIGTILGIILSILTVILLTRNIQPLSAQQTQPRFTVFKTAREGFKFLKQNPIGGRNPAEYAPIFAQTPRADSDPKQVATKEYVINVIGGSDCPVFTRLNVQGSERFVCLLGRIVEPVWNAYYGPITEEKYEWLHEERTTVEMKNNSFFQNILNKPIIGVRAWIDDMKENTNGVCAILIPGKLAIGLTNAGDRYGGTIFSPLDVNEFRNQYQVTNCGNWNHVAYGRFWTAFVTSGDRGGSAGKHKPEYETPVIYFYKFGNRGTYVIEGETNNLYQGSCSYWPYLIQSAMAKGFNGDRFYLTENDKIIFDFSAVRRKSNIKFQCAIKFYYIP